MPDPIPCDNLDEAIDHYTKQLGYRLDMIVPADSPREALLSKDGETLRLKAEPLASASGEKLDANTPPAHAGGSAWVRGRAGMEYRDLIPGRLNGRLIASHIRLTKGGEVPDYVHYHKVEFQMIYCKRGRIRVVYEDQGEPFWLETGDCVLQPPEIRHRVLEGTAGAEVVELGVPAVHETWVEHEITLPTGKLDAERIFNGQRFVRHIAADADWKASEFDGIEYRDTGISTTTNGLADVHVLRSAKEANFPSNDAKIHRTVFCFVLNGTVKMLTDGEREKEFIAGESFVVVSGSPVSLQTSSATELLRAALVTSP